jgi:Y_Y_Y domain
MRSIHQDEQLPEILWLCSSAGLIRFDTRTNDYMFFNEENGYPVGFVYGLVEDDQHNFWLSTNSGLIYYDRKSETLQNFTVKDGLQSNEFNRGAFYKGSSRNIYFGGIKGFNWFRSGVEKATSKPPRSAIISTLVNDVAITNDSTYYSTRTISLPYYKNDLLFEFAVFDYTRPEANKVQFKLEGWDEHWISTNQKSTRYSNLPHGNYIFKVRTANSSSEWGEEDRVTISIQAPFWNTNWFYADCWNNPLDRLSKV